MATLSELYESFLDNLASLNQVRPNTLRAYRYELASAAKDARFQRPLDDLALADLEGWLARGDVAASTLGRRTASFSTFFIWAQRHGYCERNPLKGRTPIRIRRRLPRPIRSLSERVDLDIAISNAPAPYKLIFTLLRETGMRVGEVLDLRVGDITLDMGREGLRVREPKEDAERMVILSPTATRKSLRLLRAYLKTLPSHEPFQLLFLSNRGTKLSYDAVHYQWAKLCISAGLVDPAQKPLYTVHQLRHTRATELMAQGQKVEIVQRVLGHKDIRSTLLYAEISDSQVRAALEQGDNL